MKKFIATLPDGREITQESKAREYSHVAVMDDGSGWRVLRWKKRADLAWKTARHWESLMSKAKGFPVAVGVIEARDITEG